MQLAGAILMSRAHNGKKICKKCVVANVHTLVAYILYIIMFRLSASGFPVRLLPEVVAAPSLAGSLQVSWHGVPCSTPVCVAMGDLQCSFLATNPLPDDAGMKVPKIIK